MSHFLSRMSHFFYLACRIFISHVAFFISRLEFFLSRISHFYLACCIFYLACRVFISRLAFLCRIYLQKCFSSPTKSHLECPLQASVNLSFHLSGMIADHRRNRGRVGKIETLPILRICPRLSQMIGDIYDFEFSVIGKIWDGRETIKSQIIWDFPDI